MVFPILYIFANFKEIKEKTFSLESLHHYLNLHICPFLCHTYDSQTSLFYVSCSKYQVPHLTTATARIPTILYKGNMVHLQSNSKFDRSIYNQSYFSSNLLFKDMDINVKNILREL